MKHNRESLKTARLKKRHGSQSRYATKVGRGRQMYGPGCCANTVTQGQIDAARAARRREGWSEKEGWGFTEEAA